MNDSDEQEIEDVEENDICVEEVDHIGVAVESINRALSLYHGLFGMDVQGIEEVESEEVRAASLEAGNTVIELLEPLEGEGPIKEFLEKHGQGIHHICLRVEDIESFEDKFRDAGYDPVYEEAKSGVEGAKINFLHPGDTFGVLLELRELETDE